jgi:hypothetical protein
MGSFKENKFLTILEAKKSKVKVLQTMSTFLLVMTLQAAE